MLRHAPWLLLRRDVPDSACDPPTAAEQETHAAQVKRRIELAEGGRWRELIAEGVAGASST
jgi:hypothetical protein